MRRRILLVLAPALLSWGAFAQGTVLSESFEAWPPPGWSLSPSSCLERWEGSPAMGLNNYTGGGGAAAVARPSCAGILDLVSPPFDLPFWAREARLVVSEDRFIQEGFTGGGEIALSEDGGATFPHLLQRFGAEAARGPRTAAFDLTPWVGRPGLRIRFRFDAAGTAFGWWEVDEVRVEALPCTPPQPVLSGAPSACPPGTLLSAPEGYASYRWFFAGSALEAASGRELLAGRTGRYAVEVWTADGCRGLSPDFEVLVEEPPLPPSIAGPVEGCAGAPVVLSAEGGAYASLQWYRDGLPIPGAVSPSLAVTQSGAYTVRVENGAGCAAFSPAHEVGMAEAPEPALLPQGCGVVLEAPDGFLSYAWRKDGQILPGAAGRRLVPEESGAYAYEALTAAGCSVTSPALSLSLAPKPALSATPLPCPDGVLLESPGTTPVTWEVNGRPLSVAPGTALATALPGTYTALAEGPDGCPRRSDPVAVEILPCAQREVSGAEAFFPFTLEKTAAKGGSPGFRLAFQKAPGAVSYALFWGRLGDFASHTEAGHGLCALEVSDDGSGRLEALLPDLPDDAYFLLAADLGGGSFTVAGRDGAGNPLPPGVCAP